LKATEASTTRSISDVPVREPNRAKCSIAMDRRMRDLAVQHLDIVIVSVVKVIHGSR